MNFIFQLGKDVINYIQNELESLEREQKQIDRHAATLEKEIRKVMDTGNTHFHYHHLLSIMPFMWGSIQDN